MPAPGGVASLAQVSPLRRGLLPLAVLLLAPACAHAPAAPPPGPPPAPVTWKVTSLPATEVVRVEVATPEALRARLREAFRAGHANGWRLAGPPMLVVSPSGLRILGVPVVGDPAVMPPFSLTRRPPAKAAVETVTGTLAEVEAKARALRRALAAHGLTPAGPLVLELVDDPAATAPGQRRTRIVIPLK